MKPELLDLVLKKMMFENYLIDFSQILTLLNVFHPHVHKKISVSSLTHICMYVCMDGCMDVWMYGCICLK
jgi:hypothetical protein